MIYIKSIVIVLLNNNKFLIILTRINKDLFIILQITNIYIYIYIYKHKREREIVFQFYIFLGKQPIENKPYFYLDFPLTKDSFPLANIFLYYQTLKNMENYFYRKLSNETNRTLIFLCLSHLIILRKVTT